MSDYVRAVRRNWLIVVLFVIVGAGAAFIYSKTQSTTYAAEASILFQDPNQDLSLTGASGGAFRTAQQRAQIGADTVITPQLARQVKARVRTTLTPKEIEDSLSATADPTSSQVILEARAPTATLATNIVNVAAAEGAESEAELQRTRYRKAADRLDERADALGKTPAEVNQRFIYNEQITRLRTLSTVARPVDVAARATVPDSPASPKTNRNVVIGGILGLLLGLAAALLRESFDRRLASTSDVEEELEMPVLAHIGEEAMGKAGLSKSGAGPLAGADLEAFRILRTTLRFHNVERPPKTILVTSPMPEEGKSTVAASLAFSYALAGRRTLLVECDFRRPSLADRLGVRAQPGLIEYLLGRAQPGQIVQRVPDAPAGPVSNGSGPAPKARSAPLAAIVAGKLPEGQPAELLETPAFAQFIQQVLEAYDAVIIDTAPLLPVADTLELLPHVDSVVLCVRSSRTTRDQAVAGKAALSHVQDRIVGAVVTGVAARDRGYYGYYGYDGYDDGPTGGGKRNGKDDDHSTGRSGGRRRLRIVRS